MNEAKGNGMIVPPSENKGTIMVPPKTEGDLMLPPQPITKEDMTNISGGVTGEERTPGTEPPKPPEMKVVKLEDGRYVNVPSDAICDSEEEAKNFRMPLPPGVGGPHHYPHGSHCPHGHRKHRH